MQITIEGAEATSTDLGEMPGRSKRAMVRAMNRALASGRTAMVREIAGDTGLKQADVRNAVPIREASLARPEGQFGAGLKRIPLIQFAARGPEPSRGRGRGVSYRNPGGGRSRDEHAFIATINGRRGVFKRKGKGRVPVRQEFGPSLGHVFAKFRPTAIERVKEMFGRNFDHELAYEQSRGSGAGTR